MMAASIGRTGSLLGQGTAVHISIPHLEAVRFGRSDGLDTYRGLHKVAPLKSASRRSRSSTAGGALRFKKVQS